jgi:cytochrome c biogenesis protein
VEQALRQELGRVQKSEVEEQTVYLGERGRFRPLGPYVVHLALLVILAGALMGKFLGVQGRVTLMEGETAQTFTSEGQETPLDFQMRLDRFQMLTYPDGTPREFRSDLTFSRPGNSPRQAVVRVNEPVTFGGLTFYQSSYGHALRLEVKEGEIPGWWRPRWGKPCSSPAAGPGSGFWSTNRTW